MHILILGGTTEASGLVKVLEQAGIRATLSLAGRTKNPVLPQGEYRIGGFGGAEGLANWMLGHHVTALVDATHPFASVMPFNAAKAAALTGIPLIKLTRPAWQSEPGDCWMEVATHSDAMSSLGAAKQRVFLTVGRLEVDAYAAAAQHFYLVRSIDAIEPKLLPDAQWITARGPFTVASERQLMEQYAITHVVTKNSGGEATRAKLTAARELGLPVILVRRPPMPEVQQVLSVDAAMQWIHGLSL